MKMHVLSGSRLRMKRDIYLPGAAFAGANTGDMIELPVSCVLLKHPQGVVLFDTGCHPAVATGAGARWGALARAVVPMFTEQDTVMAWLPRAGVTPGDVDVVVCSHLHIDHCGCNVFFPRATILAQAEELTAARADNAAARGYLPIEWDLPTAIDPVEGARDLFGDGRITLLPLPGHTPGMMGAHVLLDRDGAFVLASDAASLAVHLDRRILPRNIQNAGEALASLDTLARFRREGATILFGHDAEQWAGLRTGAAFYD